MIACAWMFVAWLCAEYLIRAIKETGMNDTSKADVGSQQPTTHCCERCDAIVDPICVGEFDTLCDNCREAAYERHQEYLMEGGGGPSLAEQQQAAYKIKRGLR